VLLVEELSLSLSEEEESKALVIGLGVLCTASVVGPGAVL
jgi:hypothetical protein